MPLRLETPVAGGQSILRGPLLYVLAIKEERSPVTKTRAGNPDFPGWDVRAGSAWNYAPELYGAEDLAGIKVNARPVTAFPWTPEGAPVSLTVPARKVPEWTAVADRTPDLPATPFRLASSPEEIELIPAGATLLRISVFPSISRSK